MREIYQNALDQQDEDKECRVHMWLDEVGAVHIRTTTGRLTPSSLVLGNSTKRDSSLRGKFGEGYKLALLVLCRLGYKVVIHNAGVIWRPAIEWSSEYESDVLSIDVECLNTAAAGVDFVIEGVPQEDWEGIQRNMHPVRDEDQILLEPEEAGRIYVGGLFVTHAKNFKCGYAFAPGSIELDRDRGMVSGYDLGWATSRLWAKQPDNPRLYELLKQRAADVEYLHNAAKKESPAVSTVHQRFVAEHGTDAVPVSSQAEVQRAVAAGVKWVLVPEALKSLIGKVTSIFIPSRKTPADRLADLKGRLYFHKEEDRQEFEDIIAQLKGQQAALTEVVEEVAAVSSKEDVPF